MKTKKPAARAKKSTAPKKNLVPVAAPATPQTHLGAHLTYLTRVELVRVVDDFDLTYIFHHALTQDAAYTSLLKATRADLHARVARAIEAAAPDARAENAAVLALHYDRAGNARKAFEYSALAGDAARQKFAHAEAIAFYTRAIELGDALDDAALAARLREMFARRGNVYEVMGVHAQAMQNYQAMIAFAERIGNRAMQADGLLHFLTAQSITEHRAVNATELTRALDLAREADDADLIGRALWGIGVAERFANPRRAADYLERALAHARAENLPELAAFTALDLATATQLGGEWRRALAHANSALENFRARGNQPMLANALGNLAITLHGRGETERARATAREGAQISHAIDNPWGIGYNEWTLVGIQVDAGEFERALEHSQQMLASTQKLRVPLFVALGGLWLARAWLELNQIERAEPIAAESCRVFQDLGARIWTTFAPGMYARVLTRRGEFARAHELLDPLWQIGDDPSERAWGFYLTGPAITELARVENRLDFGLHFSDALIACYEREEMWGYAVEMFYQRGEIQRARGDLEQARADLERARDQSARVGNRVVEWRARAALAAVYAQRGDAANARQSAAAIARGIAEKIADAELRDSFLAQEEVRRLLRGDESR